MHADITLHTIKDLSQYAKTMKTFLIKQRL